MKDNKVERVRQKVAMLKQQFLQGDSGLFSQVLGDQEIAAVVNERVAPHRERIYPPLDTLRQTRLAQPGISGNVCPG